MPCLQLTRETISCPGAAGDLQAGGGRSHPSPRRIGLPRGLPLQQGAPVDASRDVPAPARSEPGRWSWETRPAAGVRPAPGAYALPGPAPVDWAGGGRAGQLWRRVRRLCTPGPQRPSLRPEWVEGLG